MNSCPLSGSYEVLITGSTKPGTEISQDDCFLSVINRSHSVTRGKILIITSGFFWSRRPFDASMGQTLRGSCLCWPEHGKKFPGFSQYRHVSDYREMHRCAFYLTLFPHSDIPYTRGFPCRGDYARRFRLFKIRCPDEFKITVFIIYRIHCLKERLLSPPFFK